MGDEEIGYRITRRDLAKKYKLSPEIEVGEHEETQVIYGDGCTSSLEEKDAQIESLTLELLAYKQEWFEWDRRDRELESSFASPDYRKGFHEGFDNGAWQRRHMRLRIVELESALKDAIEGWEDGAN